MAINIVKKNDCMGCYACYNICPTKCISMETDEEGFWYPKVDTSKCVECGACQRVCPIINGIEKTKNKVQAFGVINNESFVRENSSSGGIFSLIAETVLQKEGVVFGAAFDENYLVSHQEIRTLDELWKIRGSKYLQSRIGDTYEQAKKLLEAGTLVLFSGTPCQIEGLRRYLRKEYTNLIAIDIACHGVPSPKIWETYLKERIEESGSKVKSVMFRCKETGWKHYSVRICFENGKEYCNIFESDPYMLSFLLNYSLRPSCGTCHFKGIHRASDITLADFWGIENILPEFDDDKGTSLVLVHSLKGRECLEEIKERIRIEDVDINQAILENKAIIETSTLAAKREKYFKVIGKNGVKKGYGIVTKRNILTRCLDKVRAIIK